MGKIQFGERLRELRKGRGMTQEEFAARIGYHQSNISKLENSQETNLPMGLDLRLANVFELSVIDLVKGTGREEYIHNQWLYPRFCRNHDTTRIIQRIEGGFEVQFCGECGDPLEGNCPACATPRGFSSNPFCLPCGRKFDEDPLEVQEWGTDNIDTRDSDEYGEAFQIQREGGDFTYRLHLCANSGHEPRCYAAFDYSGETLFCYECGSKLVVSCPDCGKPIVGNTGTGKDPGFCSGCGSELFEGARDVLSRDPVETRVDPQPLKWKQLEAGSRSIQLINSEVFDAERFFKLVSDFRIEGSFVSEKLLKALKRLGEEPDTVVLNGEGDLRAGYIGLNRWCLTKSTKYQRGVAPARALWKSLFGENDPSNLTTTASNGQLEIDEEVWKDWYEHISQDAPGTVKIHE